MSSSTILENFDFDVSNYSTHELCAFLRIPTTYDVKEVEDAASVFGEKAEKYPELRAFVAEVKSKLLIEYAARAEKRLESVKVDARYTREFDYNMNLVENPRLLNSSLGTDLGMRVMDPNAIEHKYLTKYVVISSKFRKDFYSTKSTDFIIRLPHEIKNVISIQFRTIEFSNTMYTVNNTNNKFILDDVEYIFEPGNYLNDTVVEKMNELLTDSHVSYSVELSTGKSTFVSDTDTNFTLSFGENTAQPNNTFGYILGFRKPTYKNNTTYTSESVFDSQGSRAIALYVDDYVSNSVTDNYMIVTKNDFMSTNILARIQSSADSYHIQYEDSSDMIPKIRKYYGPVNISKLHIKLLDEYGSVVDNNNSDFAVMLEFKILRTL